MRDDTSTAGADSGGDGTEAAGEGVYVGRSGGEAGATIEPDVKSNTGGDAILSALRFSRLRRAPSVVTVRDTVAGVVDGSSSSIVRRPPR
jgi:hypothetical protein